MSLRVGLTGGIGSGKSLVASVLQHLGVPIYFADLAGRRLLATDPNLIAAVRAEFGEEVFTGPDIDRTKLGAQVFGDPDRLAVLNGLVHPAVARDYTAWQAVHATAQYTVKEAAILFETGTHKSADKVVLVAAPESVRVARVMARDGVDEASVRQRMARQWPEERKRALADYIIENDGTRMLLPQVIAVHRQLQAVARETETNS